MESSRKKCKVVECAKQFWKLNICVFCNKPLDFASKLLKCLHGVCNRCINLKFDKSIHFVCSCGAVTDISNGLINCTLFCEQFDESILRKNYTEDEYKKEVYGRYITKAPCPNCDGKYIEAYCTTCNKLHCALCQLLSHRSHDCKTIDKVMEEIRFSLMKNKIDLCDKSNFVNRAKSFISSSIVKLKLQKIETKKEIKEKFKEFYAELEKSEKGMMDYVDSQYTGKMENLIRNRLLMEILIKKYDFYLNFSESALKKENMVDLDITNLANNQLLNVRKSFVVDMGRFKSVNANIELKVEFDGTLRQLIESLKGIAIYKPDKFLEAISSNTVEISSLEGYHSVIKKIEDIPRPIIDNKQVYQIIKYNCLKLQKKSLNSSGGSLHADSSNEILFHKQPKDRQGDRVLNNQSDSTCSKPGESSHTQINREIKKKKRLLNENFNSLPIKL